MIMNEKGLWVPSGATNVPQHVQQYITSLEQRVAAAETALNAEKQRNATLMNAHQRLNKMNGTQLPVPTPESELNAAELRAELADKDAEIVELHGAIDELEYRNRVLLAMCTISEGDYIQLCKEAEINPRDISVGYTNYGNDKPRVNRMSSSAFSPANTQYTTRR